MSERLAYYANNTHIPEGRSLQGVRVESAEYLPIKEDASRPTGETLPPEPVAQTPRRPP